jgi:SAM-dependent methyltransferase
MSAGVGGKSGTNGSRRASADGKVYDRAYFDRWYRHPRHSIVRGGVVSRRFNLAVAVAEFLLERPIRRVLDIGCGEGAWQPLLRRRRPKCTYVGIDPSEYVIRRFGRRRNLHRGTLGQLDKVPLRGSFDLIICADVLHFISTSEARDGLKAIARRLGGVAYLEVYTPQDPTKGDGDGFLNRREATYRRLFRSAGLFHVGLHCYVARAMVTRLAALESVETRSNA